ncbi:MAG: hypothetical protein HXS46_16480 [Theionarchaea archaeon]|nr:MAG: hypothetical protein AYK18_16900 [Theionarchaea archaeon DG-70]MBU7012280.1 hypothetical protein [Theionarchaea archaeon]
MSDFKYLKLLTEKHKEQAHLFHTRHNLFVAYNTFLIGALAIVITSFLRLNSPYLSSNGFVLVLATVISFLAAEISWRWYFAMKMSAAWIRFWEAKIIYFEAKSHKKLDQAYYFFLDRSMKEPQRLSAKEAPQLKEEELNEINEKLETIWDRKVITGGVTENVLQITKIIMGFG